ncbi:hypothetical protein AAZX31_14G117700 [Glycine max]
MRFLVALLIASLFVDKADSELSSIPRQNLYPGTSYLTGHTTRKTYIGFRDNQARTDNFHHIKVTLYR